MEPEEERGGGDAVGLPGRTDRGPTRGRLLLCLGLAILLGCLWAPSAQAAFGIASFSAGATDQDGSADLLAGSHPFAYSFDFAMNLDPEGDPEGALSSLEVDLPPGLIGNPRALLRCSGADFEGVVPHCPTATQVGVIHAVATELGNVTLPIFNLTPPLGYAAAFGGSTSDQEVTELVSLVGSGPAAHLRISIPYLPSGLGLERVAQTLWGVPADPGHDGERGACLEAGGSCPIELTPAPLLTLPGSCGAPLTTILEVRSLEEPTRGVSAGYLSRDDAGDPQGMVGCEALSLAPTLGVHAEGRALAPTGLSVDLGLGQPESVARGPTALREMTLELPPGLTINPPAADGLGACDPGQIGLLGAAGAPAEFDSAPAGCPDDSKLGTVSVETPLLDHPLAGAIYLATPSRNPFDATFAFYLVLEDPGSGTLIKLPGRLDADPATGELSATIADLPQIPLSHVALDFFSGPRALLSAPPTCGSYSGEAELVPYSAPEGPIGGLGADFTLAAGPGGGACPAPEAERTGGPGFEAGSTSLLAGRPSPFVFHLLRADTDRRFGSFDLTLPPGLVADLGSTPLGTAVGTVQVEAGIGLAPLKLSGTAYLEGAYKGAPYSLKIVVPAQVGPFDLGTITERAAIDVDPATAQISVRSDPLPQILEGVPLQLRGVRIDLDRSGFIRNPTSCEPTAITGSATTSLGQVAPLSARFQVGDCAALAFRPKLSLSLSGRSRRGAHPGVRVTVRPRPGDAGMSGATVTLPPSELLDNRHVRAVCPKDGFALGECPKGALVGRATVSTPVLRRPLEGDIYLLSSAGRLPMLATSLEGEVHMTFVAKVDSVHRRLRFRLAGIPDVPLEKVTLDLFGGRRGVIVDSGGVCSRTPRVDAFFTAQNGRTDTVRPRVASRCSPARRRGH